jgi:hypothetical protein
VNDFVLMIILSACGQKLGEIFRVRKDMRSEEQEFIKEAILDFMMNLPDDIQQELGKQ